MARSPKVPPPRLLPRLPLAVETYRPPDDYGMRQLRQDAPSCWNGEVRIRRYQVRIEEIEEPVDVLAARLQKLWEECDNHHEWTPIKSEARKLGVSLIGLPGSKAKAP